MIQKLSPIRKCLVGCMMALAAASSNLARAQFVPGGLFVANGYLPCEMDDVDYVLGGHPLGEGGDFIVGVDGCPLLHSAAMSPDGKHLRVAAAHWGAILEFDPDGNWEIVIDTSDGVIPQATWNSIAYDREGNFYVSGRGNVKVMKFPADGGPPEPLAYYNNNGVIMEDAYGLSVGPSGEVYVADDAKIYLIDPDGSVSLFDSLANPNEFIYSILVDDFGYVHAQTGIWYRYELGDPSSRIVFAACNQLSGEICGSYALALSPDRTRIYTISYDYSTFLHSLLAVDPRDGSYETVMYFIPSFTLAVVPLRGDVDGDRKTDLLDLEWLTGCTDGPEGGMSPACDLADMDADGDVDLFDARYFMLGYSAFAEAGD